MSKSFEVSTINIHSQHTDAVGNHPIRKWPINACSMVRHQRWGALMGDSEEGNPMVREAQGAGSETRPELCHALYEEPNAP